MLGNEAVGEIVAVGMGVGAPHSVGARVLAILPSGGGYAEFVDGSRFRLRFPRATSCGARARKSSITR